MTTVTEQLQLFCPIEPAVHPDHEAATDASVAWLRKHGLVTDERGAAMAYAIRSGELAGRCAPYGAGGPAFQIGVDWNVWGFAFDDERTEVSTDVGGFTHLFASVIHTLQYPDDPPLADDPYLEALRDLARRVRSHATPTVEQRWITAHYKWLLAESWLMPYRTRRVQPALNEFAVLEFPTAGCDITLVLNEIAEGIEVPGREMDSAAVRVLNQLTASIAHLDNAIFSSRKEAARRPWEPNPVNVLRDRYQCTVGEAIGRAVEIRNRMMRLFIELRHQTGAAASHELSRHLDNLGHILRGNIDWSLANPRYLTQDGTSAGRRIGVDLTVTWLEDPQDIPLAPPPDIPSLASWWQLLK